MSDRLASKSEPKRRKQAQRLAPRSTNLLSQLLDADGDGQIADDVGKIGLGFLGRLLRRRK